MLAVHMYNLSNVFINYLTLLKGVDPFHSYRRRHIHQLYSGNQSQNFLLQILYYPCMLHRVKHKRQRRLNWQLTLAHWSSVSSHVYFKNNLLFIQRQDFSAACLLFPFLFCVSHAWPVLLTVAAAQISCWGPGTLCTIVVRLHRRAAPQNPSKCFKR